MILNVVLTLLRYLVMMICSPTIITSIMPPSPTSSISTTQSPIAITTHQPPRRHPPPRLHPPFYKIPHRPRPYNTDQSSKTHTRPHQPPLLNNPPSRPTPPHLPPPRQNSNTNSTPLTVPVARAAGVCFAARNSQRWAVVNVTSATNTFRRRQSCASCAAVAARTGGRSLNTSH